MATDLDFIVKYNPSEFELLHLIGDRQESLEVYRNANEKLVEFINNSKGQIYPLKGIAHSVITKIGERNYIQVQRGFIGDSKDRSFPPNYYVIGNSNSEIVELHRPDTEIGDNGVPNYRLNASIGSLALASDLEIQLSNESRSQQEAQQSA